MADPSKPPPALLVTLRDTVTYNAMFAPGQTVVIGVSGGPDSTALLHALAGLREEWRLSLVACHLNHGFRGAEAEDDAAYVQALCARLGVECRVENVDVPGLARRRHLSAQQAARDARHGFLRRVAREAGTERIALAHTRDDRAETVLLNVLRGSGLDGVAGFAPITLPLVRPLYDTSRAQVNAYCALHDLQPRQDSSNLKTAYRRNRVRLDLLPLLRQDYNPHVDDALLRLADLAREDDALLQTLADDTLNALLARRPQNSPDSLQLPAHALNALPLALRRRILRLAIARVRGHLQDVDFNAVNSLLAACESRRDYEAILPFADNTRGTDTAPDGVSVVLRCRNANIEVCRVAASASPLPWSVPLNVPGRTDVAGAGVTIWGAFCRLADLPSTVQQWRDTKTFNQEGKSADQSGVQSNSVLYLWARRDIDLPLIVRAWLPGDRMRPRGLNGTKKVQDIFTDAKTPRNQRASIPVIVEAGAKGRIMAIGNLRADETALCAIRLMGEPPNWAAWVEDALILGEHANAKNRLPADPDPTQELLALMLEYQT